MPESIEHPIETGLATKRARQLRDAMYALNENDVIEFFLCGKLCIGWQIKKPRSRRARSPRRKKMR